LTDEGSQKGPKRFKRCETYYGTYQNNQNSDCVRNSNTIMIIYSRIYNLPLPIIIIIITNIIITTTYIIIIIPIPSR